MESITIKGTVVRVKDQQTFGSGFTKQEIVVCDSSDKYPQELLVEFVKDKVDLIKGIQKGDVVTVAVNLEGREWEGHDKWFLSLKAWKIEFVSRAEPATADDPMDEANLDEPEDGEPPF